MSSPRNATTRGGKRFYSWRNENYWSVTTILQAVPKPALINWAKKFTAEYAVDNLPKLNSLCAPDKDGEIDRDGAVDWLKGAAYRDRDRKADLGSLVHAAAEAYVLGKPFPTWPPLVAPRMRAFEKFLAAEKPEFEATEASVYNKTERYAGTLDGIARLARFGDRLVIGDYKSGKAVYPEVALQLAAYRHAEFIGLPDGDEGPMPETHGAFALHLADQGYTLYEVRADAEVFRSFLYFREAFRWMEETSKSVLLETGPVDPAMAAATLPLAAALAPSSQGDLPEGF